MFVFFYNLWYIIGSKGEKTMFENAANVQKINRVKVLDYIRKYSPVSRNELSKATGLSLSSITNIVSFFMDSGLVTETGRIKTEGAGRKAVKIEFTANAMSLIAINIEINFKYFLLFLFINYNIHHITTHITNKHLCAIISGMNIIND